MHYPPKSKVTIVYVVLAQSVPDILRKRDEAIDAGRPVPFDRLLVMAAPVDQTHDFSTANEPKELSALWSTTRWKRKTTYNKFAARCFPKVVVSSDSDDDDDGFTEIDRGGVLDSLDVTDEELSGNGTSIETMTSTEWNDKGGIVTLPTRYDVRDGVISPIDSDPSLFARLRLRSTSSHLSTSGASCDADDEFDGDGGDLNIGLSSFFFLYFNFNFCFLRAAIKPNTKLIFSETPTNPTLNLVDIEAVSAIAKEHGIVHCVDATFATPVICRPLDHGAIR